MTTKEGRKHNKRIPTCKKCGKHPHFEPCPIGRKQDSFNLRIARAYPYLFEDDQEADV